MAQNKENILTKGLSGTIARMLTFRQKSGKTIVSKLRRASPTPPTERAAAVRARFITSSTYAKSAIKDPAIKAMYNAVAKDGQTAYNLALADAFGAPKVAGIDTSGYHGAVGESIIVQATDDFKVVGVKVSIQNVAGDLLEQGDAVVQDNPDNWLYKSKQSNAVLAGSKVTAVATDLPGNSTSFNVTL